MMMMMMMMINGREGGRRGVPLYLSLFCSFRERYGRQEGARARARAKGGGGKKKW